MLFASSQTMLGKAKRLIESFWVKPSNWSKLTKHCMTVRSEAAVGMSVRSGKLCANVICPNVWRHTQKKVSAPVHGLKPRLHWIGNMLRAARLSSIKRAFGLHWGGCKRKRRFDALGTAVSHMILHAMVHCCLLSALQLNRAILNRQF